MLSDRVGRRTLIIMGSAIYSITYGIVGTGASHHLWIFIGTVAVYGLFFGFTEGVEKAYLGDLSHPERKGQAYGWFGLVSG